MIRHSQTFALIILCILVLQGCGTNSSIEVPEGRFEDISTSKAEMNALTAEGAVGLNNTGAISRASSLSNSGYEVGPDDVLTVNVFLIEELSGNYMVSGRGEITLPLVGSIKVAGMAVEEIEMILTAAYSEKYLENPDITVFVSDYQSQRVTILGEVNMPGVYPLRGTTTLLEAIALARGTSRIADLETVILFREENKKVYGYVVHLGDVMSGMKPDPAVFGNDSIVVPEDGSASFLRGFSLGVPGFGGYSQY